MKMNDRLLYKFNEIEKSHWWWAGRRELLKLLLAGKTPSRILDIGCGTGETLSYLKTLFPRAQLFGIDTSLRAVEFSKSRGHMRIYKAGATKLPFKDEYFDAVLFLDVLEHIKDDRLAVSEAKRVLKKDGDIIITAPGLSFIWSDHDTMQGHKRRYTRREIKSLAGAQKLKISFISYFNFFLSPPIIVIRLLSRIRQLRMLADYDRSVNFDIAHFGAANMILRNIFVNEIRALKYVRYPIGISVAAKLKK